MATSLRRASYVEEFALISNERTRQDFAETVLKSGSNLVRGAFGSTPPGALAATGGTPVPMIGGTVQTTTARPDIQDALNRRSEEHTSELQSLMRISYAVFCLKKKRKMTQYHPMIQNQTAPTT